MIEFTYKSKNLGVTLQTPIFMYYDNQVVIIIVKNFTFYERTKHIKIDCHYI
ncbi:unnamed protein product [Spirodela intermedia]|uniref:Uncharacterized protein n=1 Tax=Spirodela intermedia TaxID=51605 RepID=A0ABN7EBI4_SPIIN|nr:unnamed protein product [Spirodela intermedia]